MHEPITREVMSRGSRSGESRRARPNTAKRGEDKKTSAKGGRVTEPPFGYFVTPPAPTFCGAQGPLPMIDHTGFRVSDPAKSRAFYERALAPLGYRQLMEVPKEHTGLRTA